MAMRTLKVLLLTAVACVISFNLTLQAQDTKVEVYEKIHIPKKKPIPYPNVREADVMWSKVVWRMVDLREKLNLPLYYPITPIGERMSLIYLIFWGIDNEGLRVYNPDKDVDEFKIPMTPEELELKMGNVEKKTQIVDANGNPRDTVVPGERHYEEIKKILLKEKWFFDKNYSTMQVRILGICPIRVYRRELNSNSSNTDNAEAGDDAANMTQSKVCWVYYPEARNLLSSHAIYNRHNDAQQISFDDLFMQRRFSGYIYAESNVYQNRAVNMYTTGVETLLESERIKESLFNLEHDLWEY